MSRTNFPAINAKTISVNGVPVASSGAATGPYTTFDQLDGMSVYLAGSLVQGPPATGQITQLSDVNVLSGVSFGGTVAYGVASTPASERATGPVVGGVGSNKPGIDGYSIILTRAGARASAPLVALKGS